MTAVRERPSWGDQQRTALIEAITELLRTTPFADLSVTRIAVQAGLNRSGFYFYFESKHALLAAALDEVWVRLRASTDALAAGADLDTAPAEISRRLIKQTFDIWREHSTLLNACAQARAADEHLARLWDDMIGGAARNYTKFAIAMQQAGRIRPASDDLLALLEVLQGMVDWALLNLPSMTTRLSEERIVDALTAVFVAAVWGESTTPTPKPRRATKR